MLDEVGHAVGLFDDFLQAIAQFVCAEVPAPLQPQKHVCGRAAHSHEGLVEFVGNAGGHFAQGAQPVRTRLQHPLGFQFFFGPL